MSIVEWNEDRIIAQLLEAARLAIDETTAACVPIGQGRVHVDTGELQSKIAAVPAVISGDTVTGAYGVPDGPDYTAAQEYLPEPQGRAFIRPAADQEYPKVGARLAARRRGR
jgi:hypothetical protein